MAVKLKWNGAQFKHYIGRKADAFLQAVGTEHLRISQQMASRPNTGQRIKLKGRSMERGVARTTRRLRLGESVTERTMRGRKERVQRLRGMSKRRKAGSRIPIYIPGVGWRLSKKRRKHSLTSSPTQITVYPHSSRPGEPVKVRSGFGRKNIVGGYNRQRKAWRTGYSANARYMTFHEVGIRYPRAGFQQRPTVVPAVQNNQTRLVQVGKAAAERIT